MNLHNLRAFFQPGKKANGSYMGENECPLNASYRNLSCLSDDELIALKQSALQFAEMCQGISANRIIN